MRVYLFERNLMWSARLTRSLAALGHASTVVADLPPESEDEAHLAIVNLGEFDLAGEELVARLHARGIRVLAHAGHKEKDLHELGRQAGADRLATNSELTFKLPELLRELSP